VKPIDQMTDAEIRELNEKRKQAYALLRAKRYQESLDQFLSIFDGTEVHVANCIGYIYSLKDFAGYDPKQAANYFTIAAGSGDSDAMDVLGHLYLRMGDEGAAIGHFQNAAEAGNASSFYSLYGIQWRRRNLTEAIAYLKRAAAMNHPPATTTLAILSMEGRLSLAKIPGGFVAYFRNIPAIFRYARQAIAPDEQGR
jgi:TPR repeat protein